MSRTRHRRWRAGYVLAALACVLELLHTRPARAQAPPFGDGFIDELRRAAAFVPGPAPQSVRVVGLDGGTARLNSFLDGAPADTIRMVYPVYQIRFDKGWITVDAAMPRRFFGANYAWPAALWDSVQVALRQARLSVVTHEHYDHTMGIMQSEQFDAIRPHAVFTKAQARGMVTHPYVKGADVDSVTAARLVTIDYDPYMPLAPGVVLIRAAGHSPGSQMVYIRLADGKELILAGDVSWNMAGIRMDLPNGGPYKRQVGLIEDLPALQAQRTWLKRMLDAGVTVVVAHDRHWLNQVIAQGRMKWGLDLRNP